MSVNSKIILKVKEGPGVIIGITELDINNDVADFTGIQFSEAGDYIISVTPTNVEELEPTEFYISVQPEEDVIPQEDNKEPEEEKVGDRPIIAQITQPSLKLDPMEFDASNNTDDNLQIGSNLGYTPFFWYNGVQIKPESISKLFLYHDGLLPKCSITFKDNLGVVDSPQTTPLNDTKFEVFLNSGSDILKSIHLKFKLEINQKNKSGTNTITGVLDLKNFFTQGYKSYDGTSFQVLKSISSEFGLGFNSNISDTIDTMKWIRRGVIEEDFIKNIIAHSYISDNSFLQGYVDFYWSFNYVDLEKEWKRDLSNDVALNTQGVSSMDKNKSGLTSMFLTNDMSANSSSFYFMNYRLNNNSTYQSVNKGIYSVSKVYDRNKKQFLKFDIDSITSDGDDKIILKGAPGDKEEMDSNYRTSYGGKIDTDNVHPNYLYAVEQNKRNLENLVNISIDMSLPQPNFNLYKYQKINVIFVNQKQTVTNDKLIDERLTGDWMIVDISYTWLKGSLTQKLVLVRKELGKTKEEIEQQVTSPDKSVNNSEINENPDDATVTISLANSKYKVGEEYVVIDDSGKKYNLTITALMPSGMEVIANIKEIK